MRHLLYVHDPLPMANWTAIHRMHVDTRTHRVVLRRCVCGIMVGLGLRLSEAQLTAAHMCRKSQQPLMALLDTCQVVSQDGSPMARAKLVSIWKSCNRPARFLTRCVSWRRGLKFQLRRYMKN